MNRRAYAAVSVNVVDVKNLHEQHVQQDVLVGFDVGKYEVLSVCHWSDGSFERPWRVLSPTEIPQFGSARIFGGEVPRPRCRKNGPASLNKLLLC